MSLNKNNWDVEKFLQTRAFSELNAAQQDWVLQNISEAEYQSQRWVLLESKDFFANDPIPPAPSLEQVMARRPGPQKQGGFFSFFEKVTHLHVPVWQLGMAIICGWIFGQWNATQEKSNLGIVPQIVYQTDTIVREIPIYIGLGKQAYAALVDSQDQKIASQNQEPLKKKDANLRRSTSVSVARDRELFELAVGMQ